jgi:hypothetical protein
MVNLLDEVAAHADNFWFATYTEILQYMNNRKNVRLVRDRRAGNSLHMRLVSTGRIMKIPVTVQLGTVKPAEARVGNRVVRIGHDVATAQYYIDCQPATAQGASVSIEVRY